MLSEQMEQQNDQLLIIYQQYSNYQKNDEDKTRFLLEYSHTKSTYCIQCCLLFDHIGNKYITKDHTLLLV